MYSLYSCVALFGVLTSIVITGGDAAHAGTSYREQTGRARIRGSIENFPHFVTEGRHFRVVEHDTLTLPCRTINLGAHIRAWKKGIAILTAGNVKVSPDRRISLVNGYDLEIRDISPQDNGEYTCQLATLQPQEITHTVEVLVPPRIDEVSGGGLVEARKGTPVTLECRASGNPYPFFQWTRKTNTTLPGLRPINGSTLTMGQVTRHQAGQYQCIASNGVGYPATRELTLRVLYEPEVEIEESWIHSGVGNQAILTCTVYAEPPAEVKWYRSALKLDVTDDHSPERIGNRHRLVIKSVHLQDLDNYTCEATNNLGKAKQYLILSGKPHVAVFRSPGLSRWRDSYNISWSIFSYTPLEEYRLYYRRKHYSPTHLAANFIHSDRWGSNMTYWYTREWTDVILPASGGGDVTQEMSYLIKGLEPATQYEAKVQSRNSFGWSKMSDVFTFTTRGLDGFSWEPSLEIPLSHDNEIRDLGVTALGRAESRHISQHLSTIIPSLITVLVLHNVAT